MKKKGQHQGVSRRRKKGQQEMVGFVLIVILVVVALMIFLVISVRQEPELGSSKKVKNIIEVVLAQTTECGIVYAGDVDSIEDLIRHCHENRVCSTLEDRRACDYLNETLEEVLEAIFSTEASFSAYEMKVYYLENSSENLVVDESSSDYLGSWWNGEECNDSIIGDSKLIPKRPGDLVVELAVCV